MNWIERMDSLIPSRKKKKTQNTCYGVEVEVEWDSTEAKNEVISYFMENFIPNVSITEDGSLRNGLEFVSSVPHVKRSILGEMEQLYDVLKEFGAVVTHRCSTHIHVDVRNFNTAQLFAFQTIWSFFEYDMLSCIDSERKNNKFCLTDYITPFNLEFKYSVISGRNDINWLRERGKRYRYQAMNVIDPLLRQGSIEFRSMQGNLDIEKLTNWINKLEKLVNISKLYDTPKSMYKLYNILISHPRMFYKAVFGQKSTEELNYFVLDVIESFLGEGYDEENFVSI